jgi:isoleucyl-tRNA synthetase
MSYKDTLNLPKTEFPMRAGLPLREPERLAAWEERKLYERILEARKDAPMFLLHDGPPYANGSIHIGHAMNKVLKDIVCKYKTLAGFRTPYRPGWDCHGLPIELEVEKKVGRARRAEMGIVEFRALCRDYADRFVGTQREEFRRLGVLGEWDRPYLTKDFDYEASEARELARTLETGGIYRSRKPVLWCASCRTALAEAEVDYADHHSTSVFVAFDVAEPKGPLAPFADRRPAVAIWTTTPWTLPANLAIAVNAAYTYALVEAGERSLVVAADMVEGLRDTLGLGDVLATFPGHELEGLAARHPWIDRDSVLILGDHVTLEAGSGCVHTAPGHGEEDYVVGRAYGLEAYAPVDSSGCFTSEVPEFEGTFVFAANEGVIELLKERGALLAQAPLEHSYPHCWRCKKPIIFRATEQWFLSMEHADLRTNALREIDAVRWIPSWGRERIHGMVANRPDWCLSRQRSWGVPIIALHCRKCGQVEASKELALHAARLFETEGADAWFARDIADLTPEGTRCGGCGGSDFERETDILDVWFDSGVSFSAVVEADFGPDTRADLYLEGSDQHRGWFHSALLASTATRGRAPYAQVLTHGFVLDGDGRKMSKSLGNVVAPQDIIKNSGADILRLWVAAEDYRDDVRISDEIMKRLADSYRRVRNTARNLLGNLHDFDPATDAVAWEDMLELDRWALARLADFTDRCRKAYDNYEFHVVYHALNNFCSVDLSALYFDIVKDRLYCRGRDSVARRSAQTAMHHILGALARVIAPVLCFTADEIWCEMPHAPGNPDSVFLNDFPLPEAAWRSPELVARWERIWALRATVTKALEERRKSGELGHSLDSRVRLSLSAADLKLVEGVGAEGLAEIFIVSQVELAEGEGEARVEVLAPLGAKCGRCWNFSEAVGSFADHPEICGRCHDVVAA